MEQISTNHIKIFDNPYGFHLIKEVPDGYGGLLPPLNEIYRYLYIEGLIPPGFCNYSTNNHLRNQRWSHYPPQWALDTRDYDWKGLLHALHIMHVNHEKLALCFGYLSAFARRDNPFFMKLMEVAARMRAKELQDVESCRKAQKWLIEWAYREYSDQLSYLPIIRKVIKEAQKLQDKQEAPALMEAHFNLEEVRVVFDVRDLAGFPRLRPYEILAMRKRGEIPPRYVENPYSQLQHLDCLQYLPQWCLTEFCDLPALVEKLEAYQIAQTELQLFNLIYASDYGYKKSDIHNALIRYHAYSKVNEEYKEDAYGYILDDLKTDLRILYSHDNH